MAPGPGGRRGHRPAAGIEQFLSFFGTLRAAPDVAPPAGGMAAALPFCDAFVSGHGLAALEELVAAVRTDPG